MQTEHEQTDRITTSTTTELYALCDIIDDNSLIELVVHSLKNKIF